jgi:spore maturation protein CgeB
MDALRKSTARLVHFTPDTAFGANASRHFVRSAGLYDLLVTTKSFELDQYREYVDNDRLMLTTQGFDPSIHYPHASDNERQREVAFVGLAEPDREACLEQLIARKVPVRLAGRGWNGFVKRTGQNALLTFVGEDCHGADYARLLSSVWIGLGLISKRFPELHTTRTFEIPACGAALATENTAETREYFEPSEAIFFDDYSGLAERASILLNELDLSSLKHIAAAGRRRVVDQHRDYGSILRSVLADERVRV